jgi:D-sedoheptulose 7-phosphate isomerase
MQEHLARYFDIQARLPLQTEVTDQRGQSMPLHVFYTAAIARMRACHAAGNKIIFIGNGGSSATASHMANDFTKNGNLRATCFTDSSAITCISNDYGYEHVFAKPIEMFAQAGDILVAISASGNSPNLLNACDAARAKDCLILTLSGFKPDNKLRRLGDYNLYVRNNEYGFVETTHIALFTALLDIAMGWGQEAEPNPVAEQQKRLLA